MTTLIYPVSGINILIIIEEAKSKLQKLILESSFLKSCRDSVIIKKFG